MQGHCLDETFGDEHVTVDLRWLYAHMIGEYARHNGHADMIRELLDGTAASKCVRPVAGDHHPLKR